MQMNRLIIPFLGVGQKTLLLARAPEWQGGDLLKGRRDWHKKGGRFSISGLKGGHNYFLVLWPINLFLAQLSTLLPENGHFRDETNDPPNHVKRRRS